MRGLYMGAVEGKQAAKKLRKKRKVNKQTQQPTTNKKENLEGVEPPTVRSGI
jgi:hypothetical protein